MTAWERMQLIPVLKNESTGQYRVLAIGWFIVSCIS